MPVGRSIYNLFLGLYFLLFRRRSAFRLLSPRSLSPPSASFRTLRSASISTPSYSRTVSKTPFSVLKKGGLVPLQQSPHRPPLSKSFPRFSAACALSHLTLHPHPPLSHLPHLQQKQPAPAPPLLLAFSRVIPPLCVAPPPARPIPPSRPPPARAAC